MKIKSLKERYAEAGLTPWDIKGEEMDMVAIQQWHALRAAGYYITLKSLIDNLSQ